MVSIGAVLKKKKKISRKKFSKYCFNLSNSCTDCHLSSGDHDKQAGMSIMMQENIKIDKAIAKAITLTLVLI